ncbi:NAD(P)/FAD-dependent oxidoreductase [Paractinoplanes lichenicola]|uniref:FAD-dependent oxidoreductase n=1 Tax=Paractinoplanes lichenicola TaxID=2802976 RepID=A0ABS1VDG0_9ACTN|nr:FAD-dependent oxidoreductase [Actinoplanes lichenicola]MBL7252722.1 FAD-dependent oxidoreductase [Actinoplanes lichenicola]
MRVAVVGGGVVGLSTTLALVERGIDVTCFEPAAPMAKRSAGETRIFRHAHAYPDMVELATESGRLYAGWSERAGVPLIDVVSTVVSGGPVEAWAAAMAEVGALHEVVDKQPEQLRLPAARIDGPSLVDPAGGAIRVDRIRTFLLDAIGNRVRRATVESVEESGGRVRVRFSANDLADSLGTASDAGVDEFDAVVVCAGAGTAGLTAGLGLAVPDRLEHHVRFSFPVRADMKGPMPCWINSDSYQHLTTAGTWAVGYDVEAADVAWELGTEVAERNSRAAVVDYVTRELPGLEPRIVDRLYCSNNLGLSDGFRFLRSGAVLTAYGENLFKFAPLLGEWLAKAAIDGSTPAHAGP